MQSQHNSDKGLLKLILWIKSQVSIIFSCTEEAFGHMEWQFLISMWETSVMDPILFSWIELMYSATSPQITVNGVSEIILLWRDLLTGRPYLQMVQPESDIPLPNFFYKKP